MEVRIEERAAAACLQGKFREPRVGKGRAEVFDVARECIALRGEALELRLNGDVLRHIVDDDFHGAVFNEQPVGIVRTAALDGFDVVVRIGRDGQFERLAVHDKAVAVKRSVAVRLQSDEPCVQPALLELPPCGGIGEAVSLFAFLSEVVPDALTIFVVHKIVGTQKNRVQRKRIQPAFVDPEEPVREEGFHRVALGALRADSAALSDGTHEGRILLGGEHGDKSAVALQPRGDHIDAGGEIDLPALPFDMVDARLGEIELDAAVPRRVAVGVDKDGGVVHVKQEEDALFAEICRHPHGYGHAVRDIFVFQPAQLCIRGIIEHAVHLDVGIVCGKVFLRFLHRVGRIVDDRRRACRDSPRHARKQRCGTQTSQ